MNRFTFFLSLLALLSFCSQKKGDKIDIILSDTDSIVLKSMLLRVKENPELLPVDIAGFFMDVPYKGGSLEAEGEPLVVSLSGVDCVTLVEYSMALYQSKGDESLFFKALEDIRYRNGNREGYISRLHYFSEWLTDNEKRGNIQLPKSTTESLDWKPNVYYMSQNPDKYPYAKNYQDSLEAIETKINNYRFSIIKKDQSVTLNKFVKQGDIIAIVTNIAGLDITHVGFAYKLNNEIYFLHASSEKGKVLITDVSLSDYLAGKKHMQAVIIARTTIE